jgi:hypothetical protein
VLMPTSSQLVKIKMHGIPLRCQHLQILGLFDEDGDLLRAVVPEFNLDLSRIDGESALGYHERLRRLIIQASE